MRTKAVILLVAALVATGCAEGNDRQSAVEQTLVLAVAQDIGLLDGIHSRSSADFPVGSQIFEGLLTYGPGGRLEPGLARTWRASDDGTAWTFELQRNVKFHDGTPFNAAAVCANFERWYNFRGILQSAAASFAWRAIFGGFATQDDPSAPKESLYRSCQANGEHAAVIALSRPSGRFLTAMTYWQFTLASPDALRVYEADKVSGSGSAPKFEGTFGTEHPIGTGPFRFERWIPNDRVVLVRNDDYWRGSPKLERVIFRPIKDGSARRQALESGEIHGYSPVDPGDIEPLTRSRLQVLRREPVYFAILGFNQARPPLDNVLIRQAVAHALNRDAVIRAKYPTATELGREFLPSVVLGYADDVASYPYDPARARRLIAESGVGSPSLEFWYQPGNNSIPFPDTEGIFQAFRADLEAVGFTIVARPGQQDYPLKVQSGEAQMYLIGGSADLDPDSFLNLFFPGPAPLFGFDDPELFGLVKQGDSEVDPAKRAVLYQRANRRAMQLLPAVPLAYVRPAVALSPRVRGFVPHPVSFEDRLTNVSLA